VPDSTWARLGAVRGLPPTSSEVGTARTPNGEIEILDALSFLRNPPNSKE